MKTNRLWMLVLFLLLLGACTDFSNEPVFSEKQLHFTTDGGEKTVGIARWGGGDYRGGAWDIHSFLVVVGEKLERVEPMIKTLPNRSVRYYGAWYSITPSPDFRSAKVEVKPNTTGSPREVRVHGGPKAMMDLTIKQD